jgi:single-strand DNA-binding protein
MLNQVQVIGHVGKDVEVRYTAAGEAIANFSVATTDKWKDKQTGEAMEATEWHRISFFGRRAEVIGEYVRKGTLMYVQGKLKTRKWTDKDGVERYSTDISGNEFKILSQPGNRADKPQAPQSQDGGFDNDVPY